MKTVNLYRSLLRALICASALVGAAFPARADLVTGVWDPFFGGPFANLGYRGSVVFNIPSACRSQPDGRVFNSDPCSGGSMSTTRLTVEFYNANNEVQPTLETLAFDPASLPVNYVDLVGGEAVGVGAGYSPWVDSSLAFDGASNYSFAIFFTSPFAVIEGERGPTGGAPLPEVRMVWKTRTSNISVQDAVNAGQTSIGATPTYTQTASVPEPASLLLAGVALAAAAAASSRRARHG